MNALYVDGGVIGANPSGIGGTWAYKCFIGNFMKCDAGVITPRGARMPTVTNNLTEMLALLKGLYILTDLDPNWVGTIYSDSQITLGRAFMGWRWNNTPEWMHEQYQLQRSRLLNWDQIKYVLLDGHPTKAQLAAGIGKRGHPVSEHNVWCDEACNAAGQAYLSRAEQETLQLAVPA